MPETSPSTGLYAALGRLPSGIYILTVGTGDDATGMLASWIQQAAIEPPMLSVALKRGRPVTERIEAGEPFLVNVVGDGQTKFLKHFGRGFEPGHPAFDGIELAESAAGPPALAEAVATLECRADGAVDAADHRVVVAHVTGGNLRDDSPPMVHVRKRGDHY